MKDETKKYRIVLFPDSLTIQVLPSWKGQPSGSVGVGEFIPDNPRANLEEYFGKLVQHIHEVLPTSMVGKYNVNIHPLDGSSMKSIEIHRV